MAFVLGPEERAGVGADGLRHGWAEQRTPAAGGAAARPCSPPHRANNHHIHMEKTTGAEATQKFPKAKTHFAKAMGFSF